MTTTIAFVHTSPAAVEPVTTFFAQEAPQLSPSHILDAEVLNLLRAGEEDAVVERLGAALLRARAEGARAAVLTCSAVTGAAMQRLRAVAGMPVLKVDEGMATRAVRAGSRIGVVMTFAPTRAPTTALLRAAAASQGREIEILDEVVPRAYDALLAGDGETHDREVVAAVRRVIDRGAEVVVLAQVSMARALRVLVPPPPVPVLSSLSSSLEDLQTALQEDQP